MVVVVQPVTPIPNGGAMRPPSICGNGAGQPTPNCSSSPPYWRQFQPPTLNGSAVAPCSHDFERQWQPTFSGVAGLSPHSLWQWRSAPPESLRQQLSLLEALLGPPTIVAVTPRFVWQCNPPALCSSVPPLFVAAQSPQPWLWQCSPHVLMQRPPHQMMLQCSPPILCGSGAGQPSQYF